LPVGTRFPVIGTNIDVVSNNVSSAGVDATLTFQGTGTVNGQNVGQWQLAIKTYNFGNYTLTGASTGRSDPNIPDNGSAVSFMYFSTPVTESLNLGTLSYLALGQWSLTYGAGASPYVGLFVTGFQTPDAAVPKTGTAIYISGSTGIADGSVFIPNGVGGIREADLLGDASINVNFANGAINGALTNMKWSVSTANGGGSGSWNDVALSGTLSGSHLSGTTSTSGPPAGAGAFGLSAAATGTFEGALYGPNATELGAVWTINQTTTGGGSPYFNAKGAVGLIAATKQ
jgi:hypothetical protein